VRGIVQRWILKLLGLDVQLERLNQRLVDLENHFVTRRDPQSGQPIETLAQRQAEKDGRPMPAPMQRGRNWNQVRRLLEAEDAAGAARNARAKSA
jgi:hypothetical protein